MEIREVDDISRPSPQKSEGIGKKEMDKSSSRKTQDEVDISSEVKRIPQYIERVKQLPRVRQKKIEVVKKKMIEGAYLSDKVIKKTIQKLLSHIF